MQEEKKALKKKYLPSDFALCAGYKYIALISRVEVQLDYCDTVEVVTTRFRQSSGREATSGLNADCVNHAFNDVSVVTRIVLVFVALLRASSSV